MEARVLRREVLRGFAGCAAGVMVAEVAPAEAASETFVRGSGLQTGQLKPLPYAELPGFLTKQQLAPHHTAHYGGALRALQADETQLEQLLKNDPPLGGPAFTFLVKDRVNRANSVVLHELYFDNMAPRRPDPGNEIRAALTARFGSLDRWAEDFRATCMAANGWGILARDAVNGKLYNVASDLHEVGVLWFGEPLLICDVYEHAYYIDFQNRKADYVAGFLEHIQWAEVGRRLRRDS